MTTNPFANFAVAPPGPSPDAFAVTPSDVTPFAVAARGLWVGGGGDVTAVSLKGTTLLFKNVPTGGAVPIACQQVKATGTTYAHCRLGLKLGEIRAYSRLAVRG